MTAAAASSAAAAAPRRGRGAPVRRREGEGGEQLFHGGALAGGAGHGLAPGTHVPLERLVAFPAAVLVERHRLAGLQHAEGGRFPDLLEAREKDLHGRFPYLLLFLICPRRGCAAPLSLPPRPRPGRRQPGVRSPSGPRGNDIPGEDLRGALLRPR